MRHPQEQDRRLFLPLKMNLAPQAAPGLEFRITAGRIEWDTGPASLTAEAVIAAERWGSDSLGAEQWLQEFLAAGPQPAKEVIARARDGGISSRTLERAKAALGVRSEKRRYDSGSCWYWLLKPTAKDINETAAVFENAGGLR